MERRKFLGGALTGAAVLGSLKVQATTTSEPASNNKHAVNIRDYGAKGDGKAETLAISKAFEAAAGGCIEITEGIYHIDAEVFISSDTTVIGKGGVILLGGNAATLRLLGVENVTLTGVIIDGNRTEWSSNQQYTLPIHGCSNITIRDCVVHNGVNAGIGVGPGESPSRNIKILNNHVHNIGEAGHSYFAYGNGIAVTHGEDILIDGNYVHDIYQVGCINLEGTVLKNITVINNICHTTTGNAAGIKCYAGGNDVSAKNVHIINNQLHNIGDSNASGVEPTIWVEAGHGVIVDGNFISDCPGTGAAGRIQVTSDSASRVTNNTIRDCDGGAIFINSAEDILVEGNVVNCTAGTTLSGHEVPLYVESISSGEGSVRVVGNVIRDAPYESIIFNARSSGTLTGNTIVRPNRKNTSFSYSIGSQTGFQNSIVGNNVIVDDGNYQGNFFYNFSGAGHADMIYQPDVWKVPNIATFPKYDVNANPHFIQSEIAIKPNPPTQGENQAGRMMLTTNMTKGYVGYVCIRSGSPGDWQPYGAFVV
ncbi:right-handed parallel beta-helix repeat-containing protein [Pseudoalteromonas sp. SMS1]|uniref:right-handed parallel beta-helix repeat-containing protein n=1 Tax=Pseudoalteromonas sp. SMS1 TaxID=2908894 RepID=UPI001F358B81|nr:right-handed parallel beta-helix repeat-containing protein [Pseudoalteromonas sp. SMS1]MCF2859125.1 right-handed parallel beta-helix repeat-containing protein [Pseudoalteromonas sp. SMS1]